MAKRDIPGAKGSEAGSLEATGTELREKGENAANAARSRVREAFQDQQNRVAERLDGVADALHQAAEQMKQQNQSNAARYADSAAERVHDFAVTLRERSVDDILRNVEDFARRRPELFIGGALVLGLLAVRFVKSAGVSRNRRMSGRYSQDYDYEGFYEESDFSDEDNYRNNADLAAGNPDYTAPRNRAGSYGTSQGASGSTPGRTGTARVDTVTGGTASSSANPRAVNPSASTAGSPQQGQPASASGTVPSPQKGKGSWPDTAASPAASSTGSPDTRSDKGKSS